MKIETGHKKKFNTIIARSGAGKTLLAYILVKLSDKPKIIIDDSYQFDHDLIFDFTDLVAAFNDQEFKELFYKYKQTAIVRLGSVTAHDFFNLIMESKNFHDLLIFVDEIDMVLNSAKVNNNHGFYTFINKGRHKDLDLITTCRNTANIPKPLIGQTDFFYFSDLIEKGALDFVEETLKGLGVSELIDKLDEYQFLKVDVNNKKLEVLKTDIKWLDYFK